MKHKFTLFSSLLLPLFFLIISTNSAFAATINVTTTTDEINSDGDCSLREAMEAASADAVVDTCSAGEGEDTIEVPAGTYTLTIEGQDEDDNRTGDLDITSGILTISGAGAESTIIQAGTIGGHEGNGIDRVFHIPSGLATGASLTLQNITVANGKALNSNGGGIYNQAGIINIINSALSGNSAWEGGGLHNSRLEEGNVAFISGSQIFGNEAMTNGGGILNDGLYVLSISNTSIFGNIAGIVENNTGGEGGGIYNDNFSEVSIINSTISGNSAAGSGGGISNNYSSSVFIQSSTITENSAGSGFGAGIYDEVGVTNGVMLQNTIIGNNFLGNNCHYGIIDGGNNLEFGGENSPSCVDSFIADQVLGPLQDNGGPTFTHALLSGSAAIDAGDSLYCPATDQRGVVRPQGIQCDIGAYEFEPTSIEVTFDSSSDTYVKGGQDNRNTGAGEFMRIRSDGNNRTLVRFDQNAIESAIGAGTVLSAKLRLTIVDNGNNWGTTGRSVDVHRLISDWAEGNGTEADRGTGDGATWSCAEDSIIENQAKNCSGATEWEMGQPNNPSVHPWIQTPTDTQAITNNQTGIVEYDVITDIQSFMTGTNNYGWIVKKTIEDQSGSVSFGTKESSFVPQLVITYQP